MGRRSLSDLNTNISEYMPKGSLKHFLPKEKANLSDSDLIELLVPHLFWLTLIEQLGQPEE
jgi:hypothetical protein